MGFKESNKSWLQKSFRQETCSLNFPISRKSGAGRGGGNRGTHTFVSKSDFLLPTNGGMKATVQISLRKPSKGMGWGCCLGAWLFYIRTEQERKGDLL